MAYTFGGATSDDITWTGLTMGGTNTANLVTGWFYPTTLTAGRFYWSDGNVLGLAVDTTTSELRFYVDRATTDTEWVTSGAGIVTNKWQFIAIEWSAVNGSDPSIRCWIGTEEQPPVEISGSAAVAGSGNYTAGGTSLYAGNRGTGTVAFQGDIAHLSFSVASVGTYASQAVAFWVAAASGITQAEADMAWRFVVCPTWKDSIPYHWISHCKGGAASVPNYHWNVHPLDSPPNNAAASIYCWGPGSQAGYKTPTVNGATHTFNHPARRALVPPNFMILPAGGI
jgi:hypothetical protein